MFDDVTKTDREKSEPVDIFESVLDEVSSAPVPMGQDQEGVPIPSSSVWAMVKIGAAVGALLLLAGAGLYYWKMSGAQNWGGAVEVREAKKITPPASLEPVEKEAPLDLKLDSDGDGLLDAEEQNVYKTNPFLSDTDRDGYTDAQEISAGYNPIGDGKLNP
ncbi:MAG: Uncharacterized protein G01um101418_272 [Parcubacteria group bacterium Gr01-1014_18]|nr:MAG: Uncharacterized protein Greene041636_239 [Parcubacteria group bacterium Greene0416_36]TSC81290.1 MAG: Uncharacterized protein G01um101418_272 [Parcubacteria group bacterium Gr01-1014_18]TSC99312.1 MAG: Uncharacterized protein Greene101420_240 [Parcubacteria group bacterium Greene1014_20]TSD06851.1 MAG: Uncharacterized protein Greene07142_585 [Parcubacteria group bacterium Greene0714_2]